MYDSLLEHDLEDEVGAAGDVATEIGSKVDDEEDTETDELGDDADPSAAESADDADGDAESMLDSTDTESWSDDPVRMYLTQMGEIPLLDAERRNQPRPPH